MNLVQICRKLLIAAIILLGSNSLYAQDPEALLKREVDVERMTPGKNKALAYISLGNVYLEVDSVKSDTYLKKGFDLSYRLKIAAGLAEYYYMLTFKSQIRDEYDKILVYSLKASDYFKQVHDTTGYLNAMFYYLRTLAFTNQTEKLLSVKDEVLLYLVFADDGLRGMIHYVLGIGIKKTDHQAALTHYQLASQFFKSRGEEKWLFGVYNAIAMLYQSEGKLDSAIQYSRLSLDLNKKVNDYDGLDFMVPATSLILYNFEKKNEKEAWVLNASLDSVMHHLKLKGYLNNKKVLKDAFFRLHQERDRFNFILLVIFLIVSGIVFIIGGIAYAKVRRKKLDLAKAFEQNQLLLKETNHRIKNNFQMIISMLRYYKHDPEESTADYMNITIGRIGAMSKVHELLFKREELITNIPINTYLTEIAQTMINSYADYPDQIELHMAPNHFDFNWDITLPLGLMVNEMVINSLKYAFGKSGSGRIEIRIEKTDQSYTLHYRDVGNKVQSFQEQKESIGIALIKSLSRQINGEAEILNDQGIYYRIKFMAV